jgi:hypothetical protein
MKKTSILLIVLFILANYIVVSNAYEKHYTKAQWLTLKVKEVYYDEELNGYQILFYNPKIKKEIFTSEFPEKVKNLKNTNRIFKNKTVYVLIKDDIIQCWKMVQKGDI